MRLANVLMFPLAQGSPSSVIPPLCTVSGFLILFAGMIAAVVARFRRRRGRFNPFRVVLILCIVLALACFAIAIIVLEESPLHAWRHRTRSFTLLTLDSVSDQPISAKIDWGVLFEDPYIVLSASEKSTGETHVETNIDVQLRISASGYDGQKLSLDRSSPPRIIVRLQASRKPATTRAS